MGIQLGVNYESIMAELTTVVSVGHSFFNASIGAISLKGSFSEQSVATGRAFGLSTALTSMFDNSDLAAFRAAENAIGRLDPESRIEFSQMVDSFYNKGGQKRLETQLGRRANALDIYLDALATHTRFRIQNVNQFPELLTTLKPVDRIKLEEKGVQILIAPGVVAPECFSSEALIRTGVNTTLSIARLSVGDTILAFDPTAHLGRGALVPRRVTRLYRNTTTEWIRLSWMEAGEAKELVTTPGHHFLDQFGSFPPIEKMIAQGRATVVLASGELTEVTAERIVYSAETAHMFERARINAATAGSSALAEIELDAARWP